MEFAHVFARAGSKVTILEAASRVLPDMDEDMIGELTRFTQSLGVRINTGVHVESIQKTSQGAAVIVDYPEHHRIQHHRCSYRCERSRAGCRYRRNSTSTRQALRRIARA